MKSVLLAAVAGGLAIGLSGWAAPVEYNVPQGETQTVTTGFGADVSEIIKSGLGTLIVSNQSSSAFAGSVTIKAGVLEVRNQKSFGFKDTVPVTVENGATLRLHVTSYGQSKQQFPHPIFAEGVGADGNGALQSDTVTTTLADKMFENVTLTGDATISGIGQSRLGVSGVLNLNGHTLTVKKVNSINTLMLTAISIDGGTGNIYAGIIPTVDAVIAGEFGRIMMWADKFRKLKVRTNADTPRDARKARELGAEGIGLCRTEHMFFEPSRIAASGFSRRPLRSKRNSPPVRTSPATRTSRRKNRQSRRRTFPRIRERSTGSLKPRSVSYFSCF